MLYASKCFFFYTSFSSVCFSSEFCCYLHATFHAGFKIRRVCYSDDFRRFHIRWPKCFIEKKQPRNYTHQHRSRKCTVHMHTILCDVVNVHKCVEKKAHTFGILSNFSTSRSNFFSLSVFDMHVSNIAFTSSRIQKHSRSSVWHSILLMLLRCA